jgi:hypothetical protein
MTFMKPEPEGAREAKRMMMGDAALASGTDTAPGNKKALTARNATKACLILLMDLSLGEADTSAKTGFGIRPVGDMAEPGTYL